VNDKVTGENQQDVLTGQVPVSITVCRNHRAVAHDAKGNKRYCNRCGMDDEGNVMGRPNGGWGA